MKKFEKKPREKWKNKIKTIIKHVKRQLKSTYFSSIYQGCFFDEYLALKSVWSAHLGQNVFSLTMYKFYPLIWSMCWFTDLWYTSKHVWQENILIILSLLLEKLPPYGWLFLDPAEGCSLRLQQWGPSGPTIEPFGPT